MEGDEVIVWVVGVDVGGVWMVVWMMVWVVVWMVVLKVVGTKVNFIN